MLNKNVANQTSEVTELDLVFISDKEVMTDSLMVAEAFGKTHYNVLKDIRKLISQINSFGGEVNFHLSSYMTSQEKQATMYVMDKDAFLMLVMGYRGVKAVEIRYRYIQAFNAMHKHITEQISLQDRLFAAMQEEDVSAAKGSLGGTLMQEHKVEKPILRAKIEDIISLMQGDIDYKSTDNKKVH